MKSLQAVAAECEEMNIRVHGVSRDSVSDQKKFAKKCELEMPLLSDPDGSVTDKYDCGMDGRPYAQRVTFIIDPDGNVIVRDEEVNVSNHGPDIVDAIKDLMGD